MRRFPHGGEVLGASPANPLLAPVLRPEMVLSRQQALLDLQAIQRIPGLAGYWSTDPAYLFEDSGETTPATLNGVVGCWTSVGPAAIQATTAVKPYLRKTPQSGVYWIDSNTANSALTATLGNLGAACTVAKSGAEGVTFTEGVTISSTYNIAPAYGFNGDVAIFNRALTVTEKALLTLYMQRGVPVLGANLVTNGTFDTSTAGWTAFGSGIVESSAGKLKITRSDETTSVYQQISPSGKALLFSGSVEIVSGTGVARFRASSLSSLNNYGTIYLGEAAPFVGRVFVPPIATIYVNCAATTAPCVTQFDDISVRPIL